MTAIPFQVARGFEAQQAVMPDAYADTVLLAEVGMRAYQELSAPPVAEWPPRPGDLWRDSEGDVWFAFIADEDTEEVVMACAVPATVGESPAVVNSIDGPLTLVHREDKRAGGAL